MDPSSPISIAKTVTIICGKGAPHCDTHHRIALISRCIAIAAVGPPAASSRPDGTFSSGKR
jgi:hypothetical protein